MLLGVHALLGLLQVQGTSLRIDVVDPQVRIGISPRSELQELGVVTGAVLSPFGAVIAADRAKHRLLRISWCVAAFNQDF